MLNLKRNREITINIANRTMVRAILWVVTAILLYKLLGKITHVLILIGSSIFLALALNPVVGWLSRKLNIKSRVRATAAAYVLVMAVIIGFLILIVPPLIHQTRDFINTVPQTVQNFQNSDSALARSARRYNFDKNLTDTANEFTSKYSNFGTTALNTGKRIIGAVVSVLAVLTLTFMMLVEGPAWLKLGMGLLPPKNRKHTMTLAEKMYKAVSGFVNGQVIMALLAGTFSFIALEITSQVLNVQINAVALAGIIAVLDIIPLFGNPISSAIVLIVCLLNSVPLALVMLIYFVIYYQLENMTFQPYIQSRLNQLTPMSVFVAALIGIGFAGFLGALVAIPVASAAKILLEDYFERNDSIKAPTEDL